MSQNAAHLSETNEVNSSTAALFLKETMLFSPSTICNTQTSQLRPSILSSLLSGLLLLDCETTMFRIRHKVQASLTARHNTQYLYFQLTEKQDISHVSQTQAYNQSRGQSYQQPHSHAHIHPSCLPSSNRFSPHPPSLSAFFPSHS